VNLKIYLIPVFGPLRFCFCMQLRWTNYPKKLFDNKHKWFYIKHTSLGMSSEWFKLIQTFNIRDLYLPSRSNGMLDQTNKKWCIRHKQYHPSLGDVLVEIILKVGKQDVKSPILDESWPEDMSIRGGNPQLTSQFCRVELGPTQNSKTGLQ
jgi:hypothetical protein